MERYTDQEIKRFRAWEDHLVQGVEWQKELKTVNSQTCDGALVKIQTRGNGNTIQKLMNKTGWWWDRVSE